MFRSHLYAIRLEGNVNLLAVGMNHLKVLRGENTSGSHGRLTRLSASRRNVEFLAHGRVITTGEQS